MNAEAKPLNHEQFLQTYALNRALGNVGGLHGDSAAEEAENAWQKIQSILEKDKPTEGVGGNPWTRGVKSA